MLTFDALALTHACCAELNGHNAAQQPFVTKKELDETEADRILDDQHFLLEELEALMEEMEMKLDGLIFPSKGSLMAIGMAA